MSTLFPFLKIVEEANRAIDALKNTGLSGAQSSASSNVQSTGNNGVNFGPNEGADWLRTGSGKSFEEYWGVGPYGVPLGGGNGSGNNAATFTKLSSGGTPAGTPTTIYIPSTTNAGSYVQSTGYLANGQAFLANGNKVERGTIVQSGNNYYVMNTKLDVQTSKPQNVMIPAADAKQAGLKSSSLFNSEAPLRPAGYYTIGGVYGWYTIPDAWEFGIMSDTYRIILDIDSKWKAASDTTEQNRLYGVANEVKLMAREKTPAVNAQWKIEALLNDMRNEAKKINEELLNSFRYDYTGLGIIGAKLGIFIDMVQNKGVYDIKRQDEWQYPHKTYHGTVHNNFETLSPFMYYDGNLWSAEELGNYTFGYFGAANGYGEEFLCFGAGVYQKATDPNPAWLLFDSYWDDPRDQEFIRMGYQFFDSK